MIRATCIGCGCDDDQACADSTDPSIGCHWLRVDYEIGQGVCSECPDHVGRWDAGDRDMTASSILLRAAELLEEDAEILRRSYTDKDGQWSRDPIDDGVQAGHDERMAIAARLRAYDAAQ